MTMIKKMMTSVMIVRLMDVMFVSITCNVCEDHMLAFINYNSYINFWHLEEKKKELTYFFK